MLFRSVILLVAFWLLGGFEFPGPGFAYLRRAWFYSVLMFGLGSVCATIVDHWVGNLDRSNLRWLRGDGRAVHGRCLHVPARSEVADED